MRNLTKALTVVSLLAPVGGYSLGIGDIKVRSALNQNLNAEIRLVVSPNENPKSIKVNLAPAERFDAAGVSWSYFLSKIRFKPIVKPNGSVVVKVTSTEALKEPYLNFLLEVSWPKGNLYREFTVLVDPPAEYHEPRYQAEPAYEPYSPQEEMYVPARPRPVARPHVNRPRYRPNPAGSFGGQITARRNDTLWKVAARARGGSGVSVEQMMMALYDQNPQAFFQPNVNALSAGKTLKVPAKSVVQQTSRQEALAEFGRHNVAWRDHTAVPAAEETQVAKTQAVDNQLKLVAPTESTVANTESVTPSSEQAATTKSGSASANSQGQSESGDSSNKTAAVDPAIQSKIDALQKQLEDAQKQIIALKDKELADIQKSSGSKPEVVTTTPVPPTTVQEPTAEVKPIEDVKPPVEVKPIPIETVPPVGTTPRPGEPIEPVKPIEPPKPIVKPAVKPTQTISQESDSSYLGIIGGLVLSLLSLFGWMWWRKQKMLEETDAESMFGNYSILRNNESTDQQASVSRGKAAGGLASAGSSALVEESSFLNDFKASDFESFESFNVDHGDIDPVAEADVYLAYGRYQQAEDLMKQAVIESPDRDECKLKLLEIYQVSDNKTAFENYAAELAKAGKKDDRDFWDKVVDLSKDISEDRELFSSNSVPSVFPTESEESAESVMVSTPVESDKVDETIAQVEKISEVELGAANFDIPEDDELPANHGKGEFMQTSFGKPENVASFESIGNDSSEKELEFARNDDEINSLVDNEAIDFNLGPYPGSNSNKFDNVGAETANSRGLSSNEVDFQESTDLDSYEFDFKEAKNEFVKPDDFKKDVNSDSWAPEQTIDFSFDEQIKPEPNNPAMEFNFDFDTEESPPSFKKPTGHNVDTIQMSDLTDMDEIETKLDLAKAYIDMGDAQSAKDIIEHVLEIGSNEQKKSAQQLLIELDL